MVSSVDTPQYHASLQLAVGMCFNGICADNLFFCSYFQPTAHSAVWQRNRRSPLSSLHSEKQMLHKHLDYGIVHAFFVVPSIFKPDVSSHSTLKDLFALHKPSIVWKSCKKIHVIVSNDVVAFAGLL